jgi:hypothetical protein
MRRYVLNVVRVSLGLMLFTLAPFRPQTQAEQQHLSSIRNHGDASRPRFLCTVEDNGTVECISWKRFARAYDERFGG